MRDAAPTRLKRGATEAQLVAWHDGSRQPRGPMTRMNRAKVRAGKWTGQRAGRSSVSLCPWCGRLVMDVGGRARRLPATHHRSCWWDRRRTDESRKWASEQRGLRRAGYSADHVDRLIGPFPPLPAGRRRPGREPDRNILTRNLGWAIEYLFGRTEKLGVIARRDGVSERMVGRAIAETLELLPDPEEVTVTKQFASLIADLRLAADLRSAAS